MNLSSRIFVVAILCFACLFMFLPTANAYLDPGTGSFIFQALVAAILAVGLAVKVFWRRIVALVTRRGRPDQEG